MAPPAAESRLSTTRSVRLPSAASQSDSPEIVPMPSRASSSEEIKCQHAVAVSIVEDGIEFAKPECHDEITLSSKRQPVQPDDFDVLCWSSRGHADVSALQAMVREGYNRKYNLNYYKNEETTANGSVEEAVHHLDGSVTNYWCPKTAARRNVAIRRPSHDAWGIPKIVLLFCDDFCLDCYELPWMATFAKAIQPILDVLQVPMDRVVRMLLASLPHGSTIPVHHDTGEWVKHTHRVHVPVLVHDVSKILFRCGRSVETLQPIHCSPGHVFEINNQAKHAVSNCDDEYRVHLILDYVDETFVRKSSRIQLHPGEHLLQTRRSIDRAACKGQRPTPTFMILGAQKAGTTFLFELIMQHPLIVKPRNKRRETHCFDWRWNDSLKTMSQRRKWCHQFYHVEELQLHPSCLTGDSTPSYLIDYVRVIPRLKEVFDWPIKFFVTCRDPVQRAESHYAMVTSKNGTEAQLKARGSEWRTKSFDAVVADDLRKMHDCGLLPYWTFDNLVVGNGQTIWSNARFDPDIFADFSGSGKEEASWKDYVSRNVPLNTGSYGLLSRGLYELNIRPWFAAFDRCNFMVIKLEHLSSALDDTLPYVWQHLGVPCVESIEDTSPKNTRAYTPIVSESTREFLQRFYEPHNNQLRRTLLGGASHEGNSYSNQWETSWTY